MTERRFVLPEVVSTHFHLRPGDAVGDFGAGTGNFVGVLSRLVGPQGKVVAVEIQKNLMEKLQDRIRIEHLSNVSAIWGDMEEEGASKVESGSLDAAITVNALFQTEDKVTAIREMARTLRPGGKLFIVDWSESWSGLGPQPGQVLTKEAARDAAEMAGLTFEREFDAGDHHYGLAFRK